MGTLGDRRTINGDEDNRPPPPPPPRPTSSAAATTPPAAISPARDLHCLDYLANLVQHLPAEDRHLRRLARPPIRGDLSCRLARPRRPPPPRRPRPWRSRPVATATGSTTLPTSTTSCDLCPSPPLDKKGQCGTQLVSQLMKGFKHWVQGFKHCLTKGLGRQYIRS